MSKTDDDKIFKGLRGRQLLWLKAFLDDGNPKTFLNKTASAEAAGHKTTNRNSLSSIGHRNWKILQGRIQAWMDDMGLGEARLKGKLVELLEAKETKLIPIRGDLLEDSLHEDARIMAKSVQTKLAGKDAVEYQEEHTVLAVETEARELQRRSLDMAFKLKGLYAPDEINITGLEKLAERMARANQRVKEEE